uniref:Right handed beta helix domain-containing protein n=1 Tax=Candidatus Methanogaster sp. ANME-2c ERB4 TaxID=2759911 RepID=A0A7G9Y367_9EURY|nr:hypothetical protein MPGNBCFJ_00011 [Methanosarcinales archaeon ANME-2c ERB4]QNO42061.1 hypothetical protein NIICAKKE_00011 [Methanosarcinales archaeon ANME-2c ERB4]QNO42292.1 hypothetical protein OEDCDHIP_00009 [Methanosarcinales archaeon ANME-2c ERB4]QNO42451.1 hypothetical protein LBOOMNCC_00004 [Methanosarcinales archaeon ANME-2c ERB4]QNO42681.1 hypothetical protein GKPKHNMI_00003 [Methanosarcinales archaeon ANME-2c ERB4]
MGVQLSDQGSIIKTAYEAEANAYTDTKNTTLASLDANALLDSDFAAAEGFMRKTGAGAYEAIKTNMSAAVTPTVNEDSGDGYAVGSRWFDTTADKEYVCLDATVGAAVWIETTGGGGGGVTAHSALTELDYTSAGHTGFAANPAVANLDMNSKKIENLLAGSAAADSVRYDQVLRRAAADINSFTEKVTPINADVMLIEDSTAFYAKKKVQVGNLPSGGSSLPVIDTTNIVKGSVDATKLMRFDVGGIAHDTTRVMTVPDANITLCDTAEVMLLDGSQTMGNNLSVGLHYVFGQGYRGTSDSLFTTFAGGPGSADSSRLIIFGKSTIQTGRMSFAILDAAKTGTVIAMQMEGGTDTPIVDINYGLDMNTKKIENLLAGSAAADSVRYDQVMRRAAGDINSFAEKTTPVNADMVIIEDSAASYAKKKVQVGNLPGGGGSTTWTGLTDTLGVITANQLVVGNATGTSLQFIAPSALNVDKVDSCDAGVATGNVFKIPASIAQGDVFFVDASGNIVRLGAGTTGHFLKTQGAATNPVWAAVPGGGDMLKSTYDSNEDGIFAIAQGGSGQTTAQAAIDALSAVSGATNEHVLTKDTGTGNASWKAAPGAASGGDAAYTIAANDTPATLKNRADVSCNAVSDETDINTAFATYDTVKLTEGTFIIDGSISMGSNQSLIGSGPRTIIKLKDSFNSGISMFVNSDTTGGNTHMLISNLTIDGNRANQTTGYQYGIVWDTVTEGAIKDCWVKGLRTDSIRFIADCKHCQIIDNFFVDSKWGPCVEGGSEYVLVEGNTIWKILMDGIYIEKASHVSVKNNTIVASGQFSDNSYAGIFLSAAVGEEANYCDIQGNTIRDGGETNNPQYAIKINSAHCNHTLIANNDCYDCAQAGTFYDNGTNTNWGAGNRKLNGTWATGA